MNILFVGFQDIFGEVNTGGTQGSHRNYELLSSISSQEIHAVLFYEEGYVRLEKESIRYFPKIKNSAEACLSALFLRKQYKLSEEKEIIEYIIDIHPEILFLDGSLTGILLKKIPMDIRPVVYFHNVETDYSWNKVKNEGFWYLPAFFASYFNEKWAVKKAAKIIAINKRDGRRIEKLFGREPDYYLPVTFTDKFQKNKVKRELKKNLLFVGSLFAPNYQGIKWFVNEVMSVLTEYHLTIVGKNFESKKSQLERENVTVVGTADNLEEYYYTYPAIIMPIQYGAGMKVKTAEAMMYGMTIFATDEALEGYHVQGTQGIKRCNTSDEFIGNIRMVFEDGGWNAFERGVRQMFLKYHETNQQLERIKALLESV